MSLLSLINQTKDEEIVGKRILSFSYGSGFISTLFSLHVDSSLQHIRNNVNVEQILNSRNKVDTSSYTEMMKEKESSHNFNYSPQHSTDSLNNGTFFLDNVDNLGRRFYKQK